MFNSPIRSTILLFLLIFAGHLSAQDLNEQLMRKADSILSLIEQKDRKALLSETTPSILCYPCQINNSNKEDPYRISAKKFYAKHFKELFTPDLLARLKRKNIKVITESAESGIYIVYYTIYEHDEAAPGHEGAQFGIWLKKNGDGFKLTGFDTIP